MALCKGRLTWAICLLGIGIGCTALLFVCRQWLLVRGAHWLDVGRPLEHADYVMPLPGDAETRPFVAASIVRIGLADGILIPKTEMGPDVLDGIIPPTHEIATAVLRSRGIDSDRITILDTKDATTFDDARALAGFLDSHPDANVAVVTNAYHTRRARWVFRHVLPEQTERLRFFSAPNPRFRTETWWRTEIGFNAVCSECFASAELGDKTSRSMMEDSFSTMEEALMMPLYHTGNALEPKKRWMKSNVFWERRSCLPEVD